MFRLIDSILFALERLWQHRVLVFWALVGLAAATTLALSLPLYVDAVNANLLSSRLESPPYAFRYRYLGAWKGNITHDDVISASAAIESGFTQTIGLPVELQVRYVKGSPWTVRRADNFNYGALSMGTLIGAESKMTLIAGKWPPQAGSGPEIPLQRNHNGTPTPASTSEPGSEVFKLAAQGGGQNTQNAQTDADAIPVMIPEKMMAERGIPLGQILTITPPGGKAMKLRVDAIWKAINANDPAWIFPPKSFDEVLLVQPDDLWKLFEGIEKPVDEGDWYTVFDGSNLKTADVGVLLGRVTDGQRSVEAALPGIRLDRSPVNGLNAFSQEVNQLTQQLVIMVLPVGGLVLYFVALVAGLLVSRQTQEDVTLRSRGMSRRAVLSIHFLMWFILASTAFTIGFLLSPYVVQLVGKTTSFLRFDNTDPPLAIIFTPQALAAGALTALIAASSGLYMAWRSSRQTITSFKQQSARASRAWWQRMYLDVLLLIPAYYVLYTLTSRGGLVTQAEDPFSDPLAFVGPTLFALGNTLLFLRLWPFIMRIWGRIVAITSSVALMMALRELTRSIGRYRGGLLMMCFTLSLTGFTASMASTIDRSLEDAINYKIGADAVLVTQAEAVTEESASTDTSGQPNLTVTGFNTLPAVNLLRIDGVSQVSRVGRYATQLVLPSQRLEGSLLGIDRGAMSGIARWRGDYGPEPLADLLNKLARDRNGILIDAKTVDKYKLRINQEVTYQVFAFNEWRQTKGPILGVLNYFPTLDPREKPFIIANLDPIWEAAGTELPHDIWITLKPGTDIATTQDAVREMGYPVVEWQDPNVALHDALTAPARRGVLGFLSVGFIASIVLTLVGSIIQNAASFKAQATQLGALRAMGMGGFAVAKYLILSQGMAVTSGILGGTSIGALTTLLYLPLLDFGGGLPPYLVRVDWQNILIVYAVFAGVLFFVTLYTTILMGRQALSSILKLGDAA
jgi:putative ABC transport system permease protein